MILSVSLSGCIGNDHKQSYVDGNNSSKVQEDSESHFWRNLWLYRMFFGDRGSSYPSYNNYYTSSSGTSLEDVDDGAYGKKKIDVKDPVPKGTKIKTTSRKYRSYRRSRR